MRRVMLVGELVNDIRSGMTDAELMKKYDLALDGLQSVFKQLVDLKAMRPGEIYGRLPAFADEVVLGTTEAILKNLREDPRYYVDVPIWVYDAQKSEAKGTLRDVNLKGVGVRGLRVSVDEISSLVISSNGPLGIDPFMFKAQCRWTGQERGGEFCAGFRIISISQENRGQLEKLIRIVDAGSANSEPPD